MVHITKSVGSAVRSCVMIINWFGEEYTRTQTHSVRGDDSLRPFTAAKNFIDWQCPSSAIKEKDVGQKALKISLLWWPRCIGLCSLQFDYGTLTKAHSRRIAQIQDGWLSQVKWQIESLAALNGKDDYLNLMTGQKYSPADQPGELCCQSPVCSWSAEADYEKWVNLTAEIALSGKEPPYHFHAELGLVCYAHEVIRCLSRLHTVP